MNLYGTIFGKIDSTNERKFSRDQLRRVLEETLGFPREIALVDVEKFFMEYDSTANSQFVKFADIERDY